ncbi:unnamed protein product [Tilletia laevis]|uniref:Uncharacterized protein n=2 Tax=Tilletia TaxID=13289 RepID=A0A9N8LPM5_9BASI|nr:hypothetical protein CF335_g6280 [Tilletia laevis]KAE8256488.1 hypothetical protein A4X03_0g5353 [Tilletia caries]CAD6984951.1 unnamed protein product [Tilletia controversa]CAD6931429.1 unnamed protein product [Tilletia laevis]CAD6960846.1 unnamed protein product [Tilletia laevis]
MSSNTCCFLRTAPPIVISPNPQDSTRLLGSKHRKDGSATETDLLCLPNTWADSWNDFNPKLFHYTWADGLNGLNLKRLGAEIESTSSTMFGNRVQQSGFAPNAASVGDNASPQRSPSTPNSSSHQPQIPISALVNESIGSSTIAQDLGGVSVGSPLTSSFRPFVPLEVWEFCHRQPGGRAPCRDRDEDQRSGRMDIRNLNNAKKKAYADQAFISSHQRIAVIVPQFLGPKHGKDSSATETDLLSLSNTWADGWNGINPKRLRAASVSSCDATDAVVSYATKSTPMLSASSSVDIAWAPSSSIVPNQLERQGQDRQHTLLVTHPPPAPDAASSSDAMQITTPPQRSQ